MSIDYKLSPSQINKRVRVLSQDNRPINIIVGDTLATWPVGSVIEVLNLSTDPLATITIAADLGVILNNYNGRDLPFNRYARVSLVAPGEWDCHIYSVTTLDELTDVVIDQGTLNTNDLLTYDAGLTIWKNAPLTLPPTSQVLNLTGSGLFNEITTTAWSTDYNNALSLPPYVTYDSYTNRFSFSQEGTYRIELGFNAFGTQLGVDEASIQTNFNGFGLSIFTPPTFVIHKPFPSAANNNTQIGWTHTAIISVGPASVATAYFRLERQAYSPTNPTDTLNYEALMLIQRLAPGVDGA